MAQPLGGGGWAAMEPCSIPTKDVLHPTFVECLKSVEKRTPSGERTTLFPLRIGVLSAIAGLYCSH